MVFSVSPLEVTDRHSNDDRTQQLPVVHARSVRAFCCPQSGYSSGENRLSDANGRTPDHDRIVHIEAMMSTIRSDIEELVTRTEFQPVKLVVFGLVGLILSGVGAAMVALVVRGAH